MPINKYFIVRSHQCVGGRGSLLSIAHKLIIEGLWEGRSGESGACARGFEINTYNRRAKNRYHINCHIDDPCNLWVKYRKHTKPSGNQSNTEEMKLRNTDIITYVPGE